MIRASYRLSHLIAKHCKPFSEGEFIRECLVTAAGEICPQFVNCFSAVSLSRNTVASRIVDLAGDIEDKLKSKINKMEMYSIAIDESTDNKDTAQVAIFLRGVDNELYISEELLDLVPLKDRTTGNELFEAVLKTADKFGLEWKKNKFSFICVQCFAL